MSDTPSPQPPAATLDPQHAVLAAALAQGMSQDDAGRLVGVSGRTVRRRLAADSDLRAAVDAERAALARLVADLLTAQAEAAVRRLSRIIAEGADRDAVGAARVLLDQTVKHRDAVYIADRLAEVETALNRRRDEAS